MIFGMMIKIQVSLKIKKLSKKETKQPQLQAQALALLHELVVPSTTTSTSGGGSVTRFAKVMKDGPDTKKLKAEKKELRKKERDLVKQWRKDNP